MCHKRQFAWFLLQNKIYGNSIMKFFFSLSVELRDQKFNNFFLLVSQGKGQFEILSHFCYDYNVGVSLNKFCLENEIESDSVMSWSPQQQKRNENCQFNSSILIRFKVREKHFKSNLITRSHQRIHNPLSDPPTPTKKAQTIFLQKIFFIRHLNIQSVKFPIFIRKKKLKNVFNDFIIKLNILKNPF